MSLQIPENVETSIVLHDNTSEAVAGIQHSFATIVTLYDGINEYLSKGFEIDKTIVTRTNKIISEFDRIADKYDKVNEKISGGFKIDNQNNIENIYSKVSNTVGKSLNNIPQTNLEYFDKYNKLTKAKNEEEERHKDVLLRQSKEIDELKLERQKLSLSKPKQKKEVQSENAKSAESKANRLYFKSYDEKMRQKKERDEEKLSYNNKRALQQKANEYRKYEHEQRMLRLQKEKHRENLYYNQERRYQNRLKKLEKSSSYTAGLSGREQILKGIRNDIKHNKGTSVDSNFLPFRYIINSFSNILLRMFNQETIKHAIDASDRLVGIRNRLEILNQSFNKMNGTDESTDSLMDYVYKASQNARTNYFDMADTIANMGTYSNDVFSNQKEVVDFTNLMYKVLRINGISGDSATSSVNQIVTAINSGALRGEQLMSLLRKAPSVIDMFSKTLKTSVTKLEKVARKRNLSSRAIKDIFFINAEEINKQFEKIPMTWKDVGTKIRNFFIRLFEPTLLKINTIANNKKFMDNLERTVSRMTTIFSFISNIILDFIQMIIDNWQAIEPILMFIITIISMAGVINIIHKFLNAMSLVFGLFSNPYIAGILLAVVAFYMLSKALSNTSEKANNLNKDLEKASDNTITAFDRFLGILNVVGNVITFFRVIFWAAIVGTFNMVAKSIQAIFQDILSIVYAIEGAFKYIKGLVTFNSEKKEEGKEYLSKALETAKSAFENKFGVNTFPEGFKSIYTDEYDKYWRQTSIKEMYEMGIKASQKMRNNNGVTVDNTYSSVLGEIKKYLEDLKSEMEKSNSSLDITTEDLKYMRDIAERDNINRFTTAEIKVEMQNNNNINNNMDIDGVVSQLAEGIEEAMYVVAEGVY